MPKLKLFIKSAPKAVVGRKKLCRSQFDKNKPQFSKALLVIFKNWNKMAN